MELFDNIWKLVGVPVITVQLRYNGWVTEMQVPLNLCAYPPGFCDVSHAAVFSDHCCHLFPSGNAFNLYHSTLPKHECLRKTWMIFHVRFSKLTPRLCCVGGHAEACDPAWQCRGQQGDWAR